GIKQCEAQALTNAAGALAMRIASVLLLLVLAARKQPGAAVEVDTFNYAALSRHLDYAKQHLAPDAVQACDATMGDGLLHDWRSNHAELCKPSCDSPAPSGLEPQGGVLGPSVVSTRFTPTRPHVDHRSWDFIASVMHNVQLTSSFAFLGQPSSHKGAASQGYYPAPLPGAFRAACQMCKGSPAYKAVEGDSVHSMVLVRGMDAQGGDGPPLQCSSIVLHPVIFVIRPVCLLPQSRQDVSNAFHHLEDVVNGLFSLMALELPEVNSTGVQVVLADFYPVAAFDKIWRRLSHPWPLRRLRTQPFPPNTCFRQVIVHRLGERSLLCHTGVGHPLPCRSTLLTATSLLLRSMFPYHLGRQQLVTQPPSFPAPAPPLPAFAKEQLHILGPAGQPSWQQQDMSMWGRIVGGPVVVKYVLWISRRNYEALQGARLNGWQAQRRFHNEDELLLAMHKAIMDWNAQACFRSQSKGRLRSGRRALEACRESFVSYRLEEVELSDVPFPQHLGPIGRASIMVGVHGAALANVIFMQPGSSALLEIMLNSIGNYHYHNLCWWTNCTYTSLDTHGSSIPVPEVLGALRDLMDKMARV
ncbi:hypothetical protein QJQ45_023757, partial [Haematococcus lacustris]